MRNVNTIIPGIDIQRHFVHSLFDILKGSIPVCLYTYDTCQASWNEEFYVETDSKHSYEIMDLIVSDLYGKLKMDNKITMRFDYNDIPFYITYRDGSIIISNKVTFWSDVEGANAYRVVNFDGIKF
jgi:hypothetical protein